MATVPQVGATFARYRIDSQIGFGGMGVVFAATDTAIGRTVALKVVSGALGGSAEFVRRFEREAALLARLDSPHVIEIYDFGEHHGSPYIATQYVRGGDLGALLQDRGPMPPTLALTVCAQVAEALSEAHHAGVVHRDVKASNVLLRDADTPDLHAYLCDFGIARSADSGGLTVAGSVSGTWTYLAPECGSGGHATPASDGYSVGCLLWATLTGKPPYVGTDVEVAIAHQQAPVPQLDGDDAFTRQTNEILRRTLAKDPRDRYQDADQLRRDLLATAELPAPGTIQPKPPSTRGLRASTPTPTPAPTAAAGGSASGRSPTYAPATRTRPPGPRRRRGWLVAAAVCLAVLLVGGGVGLAAALLGSDSPSADPDPAPTEEGPDGPVHGDRDGDGLGDLAARHHPDDGAVVDLYSWSSTGDGFGEPERKRVQKKGDDRHYFLFEADFDGDEVFDSVQATIKPAKGARLQVGWTAPDGTEQTREARMPKRAGQVDAVPADVDGDGRSDLVFVTYDFHQGEPLWYHVARATDDGFTKPGRWLQTDVTINDISHAIGDFDGDGKADVAIATTVKLPEFKYQTRIQVYGSTGSAFEEGLRTPAVDAYLNPDLLAADVDGDGDDEPVLVISTSDAASLRVAEHTGDRLLRPRFKGVLTSAFTGRTTVSDVNGDGRDDIVHAYVPGSESGRRQLIEVALSNGDGFDNPTEWGRWTVEQPKEYINLLGSFFP